MFVVSHSCVFLGKNSMFDHDLNGKCFCFILPNTPQTLGPLL